MRDADRRLRGAEPRAAELHADALRLAGGIALVLAVVGPLATGDATLG